MKPVGDSKMTGIIEDFATYLECKWYGDFEHEYPISSHPCWQNWRYFCENNGSSVWRCRSLGEAYQHYSWTGDEPAGDFARLSSELKIAVSSGHEYAASKTCEQIFEWGGVARNPKDRSVQWVKNCSSSKRLTRELTRAVAILTNNNANAAAFDGTSLLMNSAMTKVYAATDPDSLIIYDGRVGAALGLLARDFLTEQGFETVPLELNFPWGTSPSGRKIGGKDARNASDGAFKFSRLFGARKDHLHAEKMRSASALLRLVATRIDPHDPGILSKLEKALFMVGFDVRSARA